jgi:hypothetical protein
VLDVTGAFLVIQETSLELELGISFLLLSNAALNKSFLKGTLYIVATIAIIYNNSYFVRLNNILLIIKSLVLVVKSKP